MKTFKDYKKLYDEIVKTLSDSGVDLQLKGFIDAVANFKGNRFRYKCNDKCKKHRLEGNEHYKKKDLRKAILEYTTSISFGPWNSKELSLAFGSRSAVLVEGGMYEEAIEDIKRAFQHQDSANNNEELLLRLAFCHFALNQTPELNEIIKRIIAISGKFKTEDALMKHFKFKPIIKTKLLHGIYPTPPDLSYGPNEEIPNASDAIEIKYDERQGQHLVATRDINIGDVLIAENPFICASKSTPLKCSNCLKSCCSLVPCKDCNCVLFCSEACRENGDMAYHNEECEVSTTYKELFQTEFPKYSYTTEVAGLFEKNLLVIRLLCKIGLNNLQPHIDQFKRRNESKCRTEGFFDGKYDPTKFETIFNLKDSSNEFESQPRSISVYLNAYAISKFLTISGKYKYNFRDLSIFIFKLILSNNISMHHLFSCVIGFDDLNFKNTDYLYRYDAFAYCPIISLAHITCYPNVATVQYQDKTISIAALPIKKGDIITRHESELLRLFEIKKGNSKGKNFCEDSLCVSCVHKIDMALDKRRSRLPAVITQKLSTAEYYSLKNTFKQNELNPIKDKKQYYKIIDKAVNYHTDIINKYKDQNLDSFILKSYKTLKVALYLRGNLHFMGHELFRPKTLRDGDHRPLV